MLIRNTNFKPCIEKRADELYNEECCCNCRHRYIVLSRMIPLGYVCYINFGDSPKNTITRLPNDGHAFCECYEPVKFTDDK